MATVQTAVDKVVCPLIMRNPIEEISNPYPAYRTLDMPVSAMPADRSSIQRMARPGADIPSQIAHEMATGSVNAASPTSLIAFHIVSLGREVAFKAIGGPAALATGASRAGGLGAMGRCYRRGGVAPLKPTTGVALFMTAFDEGANRAESSGGFFISEPLVAGV